MLFEPYPSSYRNSSEVPPTPAKQTGRPPAAAAPGGCFSDGHEPKTAKGEKGAERGGSPPQTMQSTLTLERWKKQKVSPDSFPSPSSSSSFLLVKTKKKKGPRERRRTLIQFGLCGRRRPRKRKAKRWPGEEEEGGRKKPQVFAPSIPRPKNISFSYTHPSL